ncbi:Transposon Tf2-12 polyprotein [Mycena indigotica]|uniref:Transposon Tf2-12 polyprotein n=1 Tax=Mycena indigotica TaxID=2126181 RepID=A0A8H6VYK2_9AGAR|nr:Transposon Tf2-12 polyprotein [Mycena indigotica]KAF7298562.1 Transposon Tf2-12 polyprotein [Mycena indigotica]
MSKRAPSQPPNTPRRSNRHLPKEEADLPTGRIERDARGPTLQQSSPHSDSYEQPSSAGPPHEYGTDSFGSTLTTINSREHSSDKFNVAPTNMDQSAEARVGTTATESPFIAPIASSEWRPNPMGPFAIQRTPSVLARINAGDQMAVVNAMAQQHNRRARVDEVSDHSVSPRLRPSMSLGQSTQAPPQRLYPATRFQSPVPPQVDFSYSQLSPMYNVSNAPYTFTGSEMYHTPHSSMSWNPYPPMVNPWGPGYPPSHPYQPIPVVPPYIGPMPTPWTGPTAPASHVPRPLSQQSMSEGTRQRRREEKQRAVVSSGGSTSPPLSLPDKLNRNSDDDEILKAAHQYLLNYNPENTSDDRVTIQRKIAARERIQAQIAADAELARAIDAEEQAQQRLWSGDREKADNYAEARREPTVIEIEDNTQTVELEKLAKEYEEAVDKVHKKYSPIVPSVPAGRNLRTRVNVNPEGDRKPSEPNWAPTSFEDRKALQQFADAAARDPNSNTRYPDQGLRLIDGKWVDIRVPKNAHLADSKHERTSEAKPVRSRPMKRTAINGPPDPKDDPSDSSSEDDKRGGKSGRSDKQKPASGGPKIPVADNRIPYSGNPFLWEDEENKLSDYKLRHTKEMISRTTISAFDVIGGVPSEQLHEWKIVMNSMVYRTWQESLQVPCKSAVILDEVRGLKLPQPSSYSGSADVLQFEEHMKSVLRHFKMLGMAGPSWDTQCTDMYGLYLKGSAKLFYDDEVTGIHRTTRKWYFVHVLAAIFDRFVSSTAIQQSAKAFDKITWNSELGVDGLYNELTSNVRRMMFPPDAHSVKRKFLATVPAKMRGLMLARNAYPEICSLENMKDIGRVVEHGMNTMNFYSENTFKLAGDSKEKRDSPRLAAVLDAEDAEDNSSQRMAAIDQNRQRPFIPFRKNGGGYQHKRRNEQAKGVDGKQDDSPRDRPNSREAGQRPSRPKPRFQSQGQRREFMRAAHVDDDGADDERPNPTEEDDGVNEEEEDHVTPDDQPEENSEEAEYNSDYTYEEVSDHSEDENLIACYHMQTAQSIEDDCPELQQVSDSEEEMDEIEDTTGCPPLLEVSDSSGEEDNGYETADESPDETEDNESIADLEDEEIDVFARAILTHMNEAHTSFEDSLEYFSRIDESRTATATGTRRVPLKRAKEVHERPSRAKRENHCLTAFVNINGQKAFTLFDSGCTTEALSPDFARIAQVEVFPIQSPVVLQLGTAGSKAKINHGTFVKVQYGPLRSEQYFDIVNLDRFDAIIGTKYMREHKISLDFEMDTVRIQGQPSPTLSERDERDVIERRASARLASPNRQ